MSKKLRDFPEKSRNSIRRGINAASNSIGLDEWEYHSTSPVFYSKLGMCSKCKYLSFIRTKYSVKMIKCGQNDFIITEGDPIEECTDFRKRGEMSLDMMIDMATFIDVGKRKVGF